MADERIKVKVTATGQTLDVVVFSKRLDGITVVLGEGVHNVRVDLTPTSNGIAYAGKKDDVIRDEVVIKLAIKANK